MSAAEQLRRCSAELDRACATLADPTPQALDVCSIVLEAAFRRLADLQPALPAAGPDALSEAWLLQRGVRRAGALLANAAEYHRKWQDLVRVRIAGYGPDGAPGDSPQSGSVCLRG